MVDNVVLDNNEFTVIDKPWDSELFGGLACELKVRTANYDLIENIITQIAFHDFRYKHIMVRVPSIKIDIIQALEEYGFIMVDGYLEYNFQIGWDKRLILSDTYRTRAAVEEDLNELIDISGSAFQSDRYHCDPFLSKDVADNVYKAWIKNSVEGKYDTSVDVVDRDAVIGGFSTCRLCENKRGVIGITAVRKEMSGLGIGRELVKANLRYFYEKGIDSVSVGTQLSNISAMRLYSSVGFKVSKTYITLVYCA